MPDDSAHSATGFQNDDADYDDSEDLNVEEDADVFEDGSVDDTTVPIKWRPADVELEDPLDTDDIRMPLANNLISFFCYGPLHLATILRQVQYLPRRSLEELYPDDEEPSNINNRHNYDSDSSAGDGLSSDSDDTDEDDINFYRYNDTKHRHPQTASSHKVVNSQSVAVDKAGYVKNVTPPFQLPPLRKGTWSTISTIAQFRHEGFFALWKIAFPMWLYNTLARTIDPIIEDQINESFDLYDTSIIPLHHQRNFWPNLLAGTFALSLSRFIVMPIEVLTVHMAVQTSDPLQGPYRSLWHAYKVLMSLGDFAANSSYSRRLVKSRDSAIIPDSENSTVATSENVAKADTWLSFLSRMYPFPVYSFFSYFVDGLLWSSQHLVLRRMFSLSPYETPFKYGSYMFCYQIACVLVKIPMETVRRRLFISGRRSFNRKIGKLVMVDEVANNRETGNNIDISITKKAACISLPEKPYTSAWNCFTRVISEEAVGDPALPKRSSTTTVSKKRRHPKQARMRFNTREGFLGGVGQLLREFWFNVYWSVGTCCLYSLAHLQLSDEGDYHYY